MHFEFMDACFAAAQGFRLAHGRRCLVQFVGIAIRAMQPYVMIHHVHRARLRFADLASQSSRHTHGTEFGHVVAPVLCAPHATQLWLKKLYAN